MKLEETALRSEPLQGDREQGHEQQGGHENPETSPHISGQLTFQQGDRGPSARRAGMAPKGLWTPTSCQVQRPYNTKGKTINIQRKQGPMLRTLREGRGF